jgi:sulfite exporter TauE/SafE
VNFTLILSALLMGLAGSVHCLGMCGAASTAAISACGGARSRSAWSSFHAGRVISYAAAGALAAASVGFLERVGSISPALRPLWTLAHLAALLLGFWLLWQGKQPAWLDRLGREGSRASGTRPERGWQTIRGPVKAGGLGLAWVAWPCGLLQSALMVAALANGPWGGAAVMTTFALTSSVALGLGPALVLRWAGSDPTQGGRLTRLMVRVSGAALVVASAWALGHGLWIRVAAYCFG